MVEKAGSHLSLLQHQVSLYRHNLRKCTTDAWTQGSDCLALLRAKLCSKLCQLFVIHVHHVTGELLLHGTRQLLVLTAAQSISCNILLLVALELLHSVEGMSDTAASIRYREPESERETKQVSYSSTAFPLWAYRSSKRLSYSGFMSWTLAPSSG